MIIRPIELKVANRYIYENHRHHAPVQGHKFSIGLYMDDKLVGVAVCGRPVSRYLDNGLTLEVTRLCTNGTKNACSKLYSACARIAKELGYDKIITNILNSETGHSLYASGWTKEADNVGGLKWKRNDGKRHNTIVTLFGEKLKYPEQLKKRFVRILNQSPAVRGKE